MWKIFPKDNIRFFLNILKLKIYNKYTLWCEGYLKKNVWIDLRFETQRQQFHLNGEL